MINILIKINYQKKISFYYFYLYKKISKKRFFNPKAEFKLKFHVYFLYIKKYKNDNSKTCFKWNSLFANRDQQESIGIIHVEVSYI